MLGKLFRIIAFTLGISFIVIGTYILFPQYHTPFENKVKDLFFTYRGTVDPKNPIYIIDIDEQSLEHFGQYPWERTILAEVLQKLTEAGIAVVGLDVMFPEEDRTSPHKFAEKFGIDGEFANYDEVFGNVVAQTPTVLGYTFNLNEKEFQLKDVPMIPATFIEEGVDETNDFMITSQDIILNIPSIQDNSYTSGFFNNTPDQSGVIRTVPLVIKYDDEIFSSLALEMFRLVNQVEEIGIHYNANGVAGLTVGEKFIPTDRYGRLTLNFRGPGQTFEYISILDIYNGNFDKEKMQGAICLVGTSAAGLLDIRITPLDSVYPGVETHATAIDNLMAGDFLSKPSWVEGFDVIAMFVLILVLSSLFILIPANYVLLLLPFIIFGTAYEIYRQMFEEGIMISAMFPFIAIGMTTVVLMIVNLFFEQNQKKLIKGKFAAKVSPAVMEDLINNPDQDVMVGHEREVTVFFSDVRNFTNISESMPDAKTLIEFLNEYMDPMTEMIMETEGTVDKFIGDAIMAYWNAPVDVENHTDKAAVATLRQLHACIPLNEKIKQDPRFTATCEMAAGMGKQPIEIGIGLNVGNAVVGEMGSSGRSDYTVIGDPINLGARLESLCKHYNSLCNISNFVKDRLDDNKYIFRFLDLVTVKGKSEPIEIWQIHDFEGGLNGTGNYLFDVSRERIGEELEKYHHAIDLYKKAQFVEALEIFKEVNAWEDKTNLNVYDMYIERCEHYIEVPPENFDGVFKHTTKG
jgi:adenylate cyclase